MTNGNYPLIDYSGSLTGSASSMTLSGLPTGAVRQSFTLATSGGALLLEVANGSPASLVWTGSLGTAWDTTTLNWSNSGTADKFYAGDAVTFNDTANTAAVALASSLQPQSVLFNNNVLNYTLSGSGGISGNATLTKNGSGSVTLATANSFSGATAISQGVLQLANSNALQGSTVSVNANSGLKFSPGVGTFNLGGLAGSGSLALSDTSGGNVALDVGGNSSTTTFSGTIGGAGSLAKYGTGTLTLSGTNGYSGGTSIYAGIVQAGNNSALGSSAAPWRSMADYSTCMATA